ncbi:MAG: AlkA N-terminal domain-containing protein, partial [Candidatus Binatia bacterium]
TVSRALRLIDQGALDEASEEDLAARVGVGARHLRRLFTEHLGATPAAIGRTRRVHFARRLITESELPMTAVAFSSGFRSIRQFNDSVRSSFRASPSDLRRRSRSKPPDGEGLVLKLAFRPPYDQAGLFRFLRDRAIPGVESVDEASYRRTVETGGAAGTIEVRAVPEEPFLLLRLRLPGTGDLFDVVERARRLFDLGADPMAIGEHLRSDLRLAGALERHPGVRVPGAWDGFELAVRAILGQQVTVRGATTLCGRLVRAFGTALPEASGALTHLFPRPEALAGGDLSHIGIPKARAEALRALADAVASGRLAIRSGASLEDVVARLTALPGIGAWTAHYVAMRAFGETDAFPASDLGLRRALSNGRPASPRAIETMAEAWRPWRAYGVMLLWLQDAANAREASAENAA